jgi:FkbM family methyltransferase
MEHSSIKRYKNLFRYVANWQAHFLQKMNKDFKPMEVTTRGNKLTFSVPTWSLYMVFKEIFMSDFYRMEELVKLLPQNPTIIDIGGNAGYFNMMLFSQIKAARVFAYEPIVENCTLFRENVKRNTITNNKVNIFNMAVTGSPIDEVTIYKEVENDNSVTASIYTDFADHNHNVIKVKAITLQQIIESNNLESIDLLKLDCEGSEYPIIYETPKFVWNKVKVVFMEDHPLDKEKRNHEAAVSFLKTLGFTCSSLPADNGCFGVLAVRSN